MPSRRRAQLTPANEAFIDQFERFLMASGKAETTIPYYRFILMGYLSHVQDEGFDPARAKTEEQVHEAAEKVRATLMDFDLLFQGEDL